MTPERTNEPSQDAHETARLPKSPCTDGEVTEMVKRLLAFPSRAPVISHPLIEQAADLLTSLSAERDTWKALFHAEDRRCSELTIIAGLAEAERDALKAALLRIAKGEAPPPRHGHYVAHRECVQLARAALAAAEGD